MWEAPTACGQGHSCPCAELRGRPTRLFRGGGKGAVLCAFLSGGSLGSALCCACLAPCCCALMFFVFLSLPHLAILGGQNSVLLYHPATASLPLLCHQQAPIKLPSSAAIPARQQTHNPHPHRFPLPPQWASARRQAGAGREVGVAQPVTHAARGATGRVVAARVVAMALANPLIHPLSELPAEGYCLQPPQLSALDPSCA